MIGNGKRYSGPTGAIDLRLGRWQDVLADVEQVDAVITDPPYSERTHKGYRSGGVTAGSINEQPGIIEYEPLTRVGAAEIVGFWAKRARKWIVLFGDDITQSWFHEGLRNHGWYVFAPVAWVRRDAPPRFSGDGPQRSVEWITVARPKRITKCGSLPGYYMVNRVEGSHNGSMMPGQKNLVGMRALVRDYTQHDDLIADPFGGTGTTLMAAAIEGRRAIGAEMDPGTYAKAKARIAAGYTPDMFGGAA